MRTNIHLFVAFTLILTFSACKKTKSNNKVKYKVTVSGSATSNFIQSFSTPYTNGTAIITYSGSTWASDEIEVESGKHFLVNIQHPPLPTQDKCSKVDVEVIKDNKSIGSKTYYMGATNNNTKICPNGAAVQFDVVIP